MNTEIIDNLRRYEEVTRTLQAFEAGGRIVSMSVSTPPPIPPDTPPDPGLPPGPPWVPPPVIFAVIDTTDIVYPVGMVDAIKEALTKRRHMLVDELGRLGVSGLGS
jgi:hypothetical protein